jgi:small multidrug resistance family-3 protein
MRKLINSLLEAGKQYNVWDYTFFKTSLMTIGIIVGVYFTEFFGKYISVVWTVAIASYIWIMYKTFITYRK